MRDLETSLSRLHKSPFLNWSRGRKWVPSAFRPLDTSLSRPQQSRILGRSIFKCHSTTWFVALSTWKSRIFGSSRTRERFQSDIPYLETLHFRLHTKSILGLSRGRIWVRRALQPLENSIFEFTQVAFFDDPEAANKLKVPCEPLKHRFLYLNQIPFWNSQEAEN